MALLSDVTTATWHLVTSLQQHDIA